MVNKITALKIQKRNQNRVSVYLDEKYAFGLSKIVAAWLKVGQELTDEKIAELKEKDNNEIALQKALNFLSYRPRSEDEVHKNLNKHGYEEEVIEDILERLRHGHLVDDTKFTEMWVENRSEFRPRGCRVLRMELHQKGVAEDIIDPALEDLDEEELAYKAASKQIRKYRNLEWPDYRKKMSGFLARRGFDYGIISNIIKKVWEENSPQITD